MAARARIGFVGRSGGERARVAPPAPEGASGAESCRRTSRTSPTRRSSRSSRAPDDVALAELYDRYGRVAYGLAFRVLRDASLAEDAVQEAFLAVWRTAARFVPERAKASTWILTLVHRRAVDLVRREERRRGRAARRGSSRRGDGDRRGGLAPARARARPGGAARAARPAARGDRARLLRRLHPVRARREARSAARYHQEQDVRRPRTAARPARTRRGGGGAMEHRASTS